MTTPVIIPIALSATDSLFALLSILYVSISVYLYYILRSRDLIARLLRRDKPDSLEVFFLIKVSGLILFGIIPFIILSITTGLNIITDLLTPGLSGQYWYLLPIIFTVITLLSFGSSKRKNSKIQLVKKKEVTPEFRLVTIGGWILYILGYEFLFRGILWVTCYAAFGFWTAFAVNIVLYALAHLDQGRFMTYGAIPFGALLCYLTFLTGSFLFAFLIHSWLAMNNLVFPVYSNPSTETGVNMKGNSV